MIYQIKSFVNSIVWKALLQASSIREKQIIEQFVTKYNYLGTPKWGNYCNIIFVYGKLLDTRRRYQSVWS